jgi:uncharacterized RmlC-like cupin family protein
MGVIMSNVPFSATGNSFSIREWRGSGPPKMHVHHGDDEAWHVLEGELEFRYPAETETAGPGATVFVPAGRPHTYIAKAGTRYLIVLTPRIAALIAALQTERDQTNHAAIYRQFESELLE